MLPDPFSRVTVLDLMASGNEPPARIAFLFQHLNRALRGADRRRIVATTLASAVICLAGAWVVPHFPNGRQGGTAPLSRGPVDFDVPIDATNAVLAFTVPDSVTEARRPGTRIERVTVRQGDTLMGVLTRADVDRGEAHEAISALRKVFDPRDLLPDTQLALKLQPLTRATDGPVSFRGFTFQPDILHTIGVSRTWNNGFESFVSKTPLVREKVHASGTITSSLYQDAAAADVPAPIIAELIHAMSYDVDFQREIQPGDAFDLLYDELVDVGGSVVGAGDVIYAALTLSGKRIAIYRFRLDDGSYGYFHGDGKSTRKALLRTPIDGARISSTFGMREHPILGYTRMHKGVDFAAPRGTPILAAGDGVIQRANRYGSFGNYVRIRHNSTYSTAYAHMRGFAKGIHRGVRVTQGEVIGYVGTTGRSTGPHLHYEVLKNGHEINPLKLKLPTRKQLAGDDLKRFRAWKEEIDRALTHPEMLLEASAGSKGDGTAADVTRKAAK